MDRPTDRLNLPLVCTQQKMVFLMLGGVGACGLTVRTARAAFVSRAEYDENGAEYFKEHVTLLPQQSNGIQTTVVTSH